MRIPYTATIGIIIGAALLVLSASLACGKEDHERIAEDVAREWTMDEAEGVSKEIAAVATRWYGHSIGVRVSGGLVPSTRKELHDRSISTAADADQIRDTIQWEFAPPTKTADGRYEVIATASVSFDVAPSESTDILSWMPDLFSYLKVPYGGSVDYTLEVDTTAREVINAKMPLISVRLREVPRGGNLN
jgi:hypothetical protein